MYDPIMCTWTRPPLLSLVQLSLVLGEGVLKHLGDPYKGRIPLPSVPYYRARDLSRHLTRMANSNTPNLNEREYFPNGNRMSQSYLTIVTE